MEKLTYQKYKGCNEIITINLHNGYTVITIKYWNKKTHHYKVELRLKENTIERWDLIEKAASLEFKTNPKIINSAILSQVATYLQEGFFDYYIKRFEYECSCFDIGSEVIEWKEVR